MDTVRAIVLLGLFGAMLSSMTFRWLAGRNVEKDANPLRTALDESGFTPIGERYLRQSYYSMAIAFVLGMIAILILRD